jgi:hypothetical protein
MDVQGYASFIQGFLFMLHVSHVYMLNGCVHPNYAETEYNA